MIKRKSAQAIFDAAADPPGDAGVIARLQRENARLRERLAQVESDAGWAATQRSEERQTEFQRARRGDEFS